MSMAWEVSVEDIGLVLARNNLDRDAVEVFDEHFVCDSDNTARVERAALAYLDFDEQVASALDEIEVILIETGVIVVRE